MFKDQIAAQQVGQQWTVLDGLILHDQRVFLPSASPLVDTTLQMSHSIHEGTQKTLHHLHATFYVEHDRQLVKDFVKACMICQKNKIASLNPAGLLQPLPMQCASGLISRWTSSKPSPRFMARASSSPSWTDSQSTPILYPWATPTPPLPWPRRSSMRLSGSMAFRSPLSATVIRCSLATSGVTCSSLPAST